MRREYAIIYCIIASTLVLMPLIGWNPLPEPRKIVSLTLPFAAILIAGILHSAYKRNALISASILCLLVFSNLLSILPLYPLKLLNLEDRISYSEEHYSGFVDRSLKPNSGLIPLIFEISHDYSSIHDAIFPAIIENGLAYKGMTIYTDLDHNQLNYHAVKRGIGIKFLTLEDIQENASVFLINYDENKEMLLSRASKYKTMVIRDYQDTAWMDSPNPVYRRYSMETKKTMLLMYDEMAGKI